MRCFIAIELPENIRSALSYIEGKLKKTNADIRWVKPENIHLTLKFLGNVGDATVKKIIELMEKSCRRYNPFYLEIKGVGMFPDKRYPRVLWVGVIDNNILKTLQKDIDDSMATIGFEKDKRFNAHLTLGRFRSSKGKDAILDAIRELEGDICGTIEVKSISLMESILHPEGARYTKITEVPLKPS